MKPEEANSLIPGASYVLFAGAKYRFAGLGHTGIHLAIYDEPPSLHTDLILTSDCGLIPDNMSNEKMINYKERLAEVLSVTGKLTSEDLDICFEYANATPAAPESRGARDVLAKHWKRVTDKPFDAMTEKHLQYVIDAMNEFAAERQRGEGEVTPLDIVADATTYAKEASKGLNGNGAEYLMMGYLAGAKNLHSRMSALLDKAREEANKEIAELKNALRLADEGIQLGQACRSQGDFDQWVNAVQEMRPKSAIYNNGTGWASREGGEK
jgi:hypothetical protein